MIINADYNMQRNKEFIVSDNGNPKTYRDWREFTKAIVKEYKRNGEYADISIRCWNIESLEEVDEIRKKKERLLKILDIDNPKIKLL